MLLKGSLKCQQTGNNSQMKNDANISNKGGKKKKIRSLAQNLLLLNAPLNTTSP